MKYPISRPTKPVRAIAAMALLFAVACAFAAAPSAEPSKEAREKMAVLHDQMAQCLRSEKSFAQCHDQMLERCRQLGPQSCPMMGAMGMHGGTKPSPPQQPDSH